MYTFEELLFELGFCDLNLDSFVDLLGVSALVICVILDCGREKSVDESSLSKSRFTSNLPHVSRGSSSYRIVEFSMSTDHNCEGSTSLCDNLVSLVREVRNADGRPALYSWSHFDEIAVMSKYQKTD